MAKVVVSENITLDGVVEDPTGEDGFKHGGWFSQMGDKDREAWAKVEFGEALQADAILLGRKSYEYFAPRWSSRPGEWADRLRSLPKYVLSSTLVDPDWRNSIVIKGDAVNEVSKLKHEINGEIVVYASRQLVGKLLEHDLVDELRLMVYPFLLGAGERLFGEIGHEQRVRLLGTRAVGEGLASLTYEILRRA
jgi:dihydrofolate reductase